LYEAGFCAQVYTLILVMIDNDVDLTGSESGQEPILINQSEMNAL
jgi:hypothetical protein